MRSQGSVLRAGSFLSPGKEAAVTRESKLALIIGFVLVLVVGVLVSDHFSQASTMSLDTTTPKAGQFNTPLADLGPREERAIENAIDRAPSAKNDANAVSQRQFDEEAFEPIVIAQGGSIIEQAIKKAQEVVDNTNLPEAAGYVITEPTSLKGKPTSRPLPEKTYQNYTVVSGDSLIKLARRFFGDGERWREIESLNADVLGPDSILQIGMTLKLPADARILTRGSRERKAAGSSTGTPGTYTVQRGDTLGEISIKLLGTSKRMGEIVSLNGLESADEIFVGMTLKIPAK
jgi:nucleoid-associated protein YgaU